MDTKIRELLIKNIGVNRFNHSLGVMETSIKLAIKYNYDIDKARIAGLLHDCGKYPDLMYLLKRVSEFDIILDDVMKLNKELIHGPLGSKIAEFEYMIKDKEILDSIYYHTTGRENMTLLDKIVYLADYIEPGRVFPGVDKVRELAFENLNQSVLLSMDSTLKYLLDHNKLIHMETIKARNYLLSREKSEKDV